jgi:hypothetical protein
MLTRIWGIILIVVITTLLWAISFYGLSTLLDLKYGL